jgi:threonine/homoserine/homoserine lactone efflux protein
MDYVVALGGLAAVHLLAVASPGPSTMLMIQTSAVAGRRSGLWAALAMMLGAMVWAMAALFGLHVLFERFAWVYTAFRLAGAAYLLYLAVVMWRHARDPLVETPVAAGASLSGRRAFFRALLLQLSNPKLIVFYGSIFLSLLPHDLPPSMDGVVMGIVAFNEFTWFAILALVFSGGTARAFYRRTKFWLDRFMGGALGLLGLRLALVSR